MIVKEENGSMRALMFATASVAFAITSANASEIAAPKKSVVPEAGACAPGFVHRGARATDVVCVTSKAHDRTIQENKDAPTRVDPKGAHGPLSCVSGFVWRAAFEGDGVCVTPAIRTTVAEENRLGPERTLAFQTDAAARPEGPWLCGRETTDPIGKTRSGHVIDLEGRVWTYGYDLLAPYRLIKWKWREHEKATVVTLKELNERYAGATRAGGDIAIEDVAPHLPLIAEAAKVEAIETNQLHRQDGTSTLYCLAEGEAKGTYREIVLEERGVGVRVNPSPAARDLKAWFQPHFRYFD